MCHVITLTGSNVNLLSIFMSLEADKTKSLGFATFISHNTDTERRPYKKCIQQIKHATLHLLASSN